MSAGNCFPCSVRACDFNVDDFATYSLTDSLVFNGVPLSFVVSCPEGYFCGPGTFPRTITYPPGTFVIPLQPPIPGTPIVIQLMGCQSLVTIVLPAGSSAALIQAAANSVIYQVAAQQAQCDALSPPPPGTPKPSGPSGPVGPNIPGGSPLPPPKPLPEFFNETVYYNKTCGAGESLTLAVTPPSWITLDVGNSRLVGAAHIYGGTSQVAANDTAQGILDDWASSAVSASTLFCMNECITNNSILPDGTVGNAYSVTLTPGVPTTPGPVVFSVVAGSLPTGLSLSASTGIISGTPTVDGGPTAFTIQFDNGVFTCTKEFTIEVLPGSTCPTWADLLWGVPNFDLGPYGGVMTFSPSSAAGATFTTVAVPVVPPMGPPQPNYVIMFPSSGALGITASLNVSCSSAKACNLHIEITGILGTHNYFRIKVTTLAGLLVDYFPVDIAAPVTIDLPFATLATDTVTVNVYIESDTNSPDIVGGGPCGLTVNGTFSVL